MIVDFINIDEANVYGLLHPRIVIIGNIEVKDYQFELIVDGKPISFYTRPYAKRNGFCIEASLRKDQHNIELYINHDNQKYLVCTRKNSYFKRIKSKLRKLFHKMGPIIIKSFSKIWAFFSILIKGIRFLWREHHFLVPFSMWKYYAKKFKDKMKVFFKGEPYYQLFSKDDYNKWLNENKEELITHFSFDYNPLISILIPVYNIERKYLSECLDSVLNQTYSNFEVCLVDDCSIKQETKDTLEEYQKKDPRIKVKYRKENGHISKTTNDALAMANGEFVALMDNDDLLAPNALYENVKVLNEDSSYDLIYSDEDKIDMKNHFCDPHFKPDFSPDTLLGSNYICHFPVLRKSIMEKIGGFRVGYEGAQDFDLFLRFTEETQNVYHIPKILYHWRMIPGSTAATIDNKAYAIEKGKRTLEDALQRRNLNATVSIHPSAPYFFVNYKYDIEPFISIIIPTRDYADILENCLSSIYKKTNYTNYEVIIVNNNSQKQETFDLFDTYKSTYDNFKVIDANFEFNYSKLNNIAVKQCRGDYVVLLNNDTEVISSDWLATMVSYAMQPHIGAVGPKLLYPDDTIQHGGVVLGVGGIANHAFLNYYRDSLGFYGRLAVPYNYSAVTAACLMVSKKKFMEVNGLEETLMVAFNDVDFNMKLLEAGYYNLFVPQVELYHHESKSRGLDTTDEKYKRFLSEHDFMHEKWKNKLQEDKFYNSNLSLKKCFVLDKKTES